MSSLKTVIVDIDGTLADVRHRLHHIEVSGKKNWQGFFEAADRDRPIRRILDQVREMANDHAIVIVTGRPEKYRPPTEKWLKKHNVPYEKLYMRRNGDHRPDYEAKSAVLDEIPPANIVLAIDDRPPVCEMWERNGIKCMLVRSDVETQQVNEEYQKASIQKALAGARKPTPPKRTRRRSGKY
jgi:uncharacterized HAD superfamily protein